jgi:hypothetical protein
LRREQAFKSIKIEDEDEEEEEEEEHPTSNGDRQDACATLGNGR